MCVYKLSKIVLISTDKYEHILQTYLFNSFSCLIPRAQAFRQEPDAGFSELHRSLSSYMPHMLVLVCFF